MTEMQKYFSPIGEDDAVLFDAVPVDIILIVDWVLTLLAGIFDSVKLMIPCTAAVFPTPFQTGARESTVSPESGNDIVHECKDGRCTRAFAI